VLGATFKSLLARKLRLFLTGLAIVLGVGMTAGSFILTDTALKSFDDLFGDIYKGTAVVVQAQTAFDPGAGGGSGGGGSERKPIPASMLPKVAAVDGVAAADGSIGSTAWIVDPATGKIIQNGGAPPLGGSWDANTTTLTIDPGGAPPSGPDQVVIDAGTAKEHGLQVGQQVKVVTPTGPGEFTISGVARFGSSESLLGATLALFDTPTAQKVFDREGEFDAIYVKADDGVGAGDLAPRVQSVLPSGYEAITSESAAAQQQDQVSTGLGFLRTFFLIFGLVALFVGAFIIFNTFNIVVAQRSRELALFRALGASRRQVLNSILVESVVVGVGASLVGVALGLVLALALKALLNGLGLKLPPTSLVVEPRTVIVSLILGTGITIVAAMLPAFRASRLAPVEALRESTGQRSSIAVRTAIGSLITLLGIAQVGAALFGDVSNAGLLVGVGAALTFVGVAMLTPLFARPLSSAIGRPFRRSAPGKLGSENANRNPRRTASTAAALMIGLGLVTFVWVFAASLKASATATLDQVLRADLTLSNSQFNPMSPQLAKDLSGDADLSTVTPLRQSQARAGSSDTFVVGIDPALAPQVMNVEMVSGSLEALSEPNSAIVSRTEADGKDLTVGSTVDMTWLATGKAPLRVVGIYENNGLLNDYAVSLDTYDANVEQLLDLTVFVNVRDGVSVADAKTKIDALLEKDYPGVQANDQDAIKQQYLTSVDQLLAIVSVLLLLSVIISFVGIVNTLGLSIFERVRELGLLRAVGMSRTQVKRMVRVEAVIVAILGALLGLVIGIAFAWAMQRALADIGVSKLSIPGGQLIFLLIVAIGLGILAAIFPARRAAKLNVLEAISYE
jgi:putative ABC transport system permease protein